MATSISLNYHASPAETCRTETLPTITNLSLNSVAQGSQQYTTPTEIIYNQYGITNQNYNSGLRQPQMRTFIGPDTFFNGCVNLIGKDNTVCPNQRNAVPSANVTTMYNELFKPFADTIGNSAPGSCSACRDSYSSTLGWEKTSNGKLNWQQSPAAMNVASCSL